MFLKNAFVGMVTGNILGIPRLFSKNDAVWCSDFYFKYQDDYVIPTIMAAGLVLFSFPFIFVEYFARFFVLIAELLFVIGSLILIQSVHYLDKLHIYEDHFEIRLFLQKVISVNYSDVRVVYKKNGFFKIIYKHPVYGLTTLDQWKIPSGVLEGIIDPEKVRDNPPVIEKIKVNPEKLHQKIFYASVILINPVVFLLIFTFLFGPLFLNPIIFFAIDISGAYSREILSLSTKKELQKIYKSP